MVVLYYQFPILETNNDVWQPTSRSARKKSMVFSKSELWYLQSAFGSDTEKH